MVGIGAMEPGSSLMTSTARGSAPKSNETGARHLCLDASKPRQSGYDVRAICATKENAARRQTCN